MWSLIKDHAPNRIERKSISSQSGFCIIQVLVAVIVLGFIITAFYKFANNSLRQQKTLEHRDSMLKISQEIRQMLKDERACINTFSFLTKTQIEGALPVNIQNIKDAGPSGGSTYYSVGTLYDQNSIRMTSIKIDDKKYQGLETGRNKYLLKFSIEFAKPAADSAGLAKYAPRTFDIAVIFKTDLVDTTDVDKLYSCTVLGDEEADLWVKEQSGNTYYGGGKVAIGLHPPDINNASIFQVQGDTLIEGDTHIEGKTIVNKTLEVEKEIRIGNSNSLVCNAAFEGGLRYNAAAKYMEFCDGTSWRSVAPKTTQIVFSTPGTTSWTVPVGVMRLRVRLVGGGGGGSGYDTNRTGGGGGAGGYCEGFFDVNPRSNISLRVGSGGMGTSSTDASSGSSSYFGSFCTAQGGGGGNSVPNQAGGGGGTASGGTLNIVGGAGGDGGIGPTAGLPTGNGGASAFGGGGRAGTYAGVPGVAAGSGGGAGYQMNGASPSVGGNGANGIVIIEY